MKLFKNQKGYHDVVIVTLIGGILGSLFITGVFIWKEVEVFNTANQVNQFIEKIVNVEKEVISEDEAEEKNVWIYYSNEDYNNEEYNFSLKFPEIWQNYYVTKNNQTLVFSLSEKLEGLFYITIYNKEQWDKEQTAYEKRGNKPPGLYLGEDDNYVYGGQVTQDNIEVTSREEVIDILETFKFIENKDTSKEGLAPIGSRISYGSGAGSVEEYRADCDSRGGKFNSCDSACPPGAMCIQACFFSCDLSK